LSLSSLLNIYYLLDPVARGIFKPKMKVVKIDRHPLVILPPVLTAALSVVLFFFADTFLALAEAMVTR
ncbi:MAG: monovalent cation/H+ antiporter subunit D family protein, partial [Alphaproteobacteria bacterium]